MIAAPLDGRRFHPDRTSMSTRHADARKAQITRDARGADG